MLAEPTLEIPWKFADIQYLPTHRCPLCDAPGVPTLDGRWYSPWLVLGPGACALDAWGDHLAYLRFACERACHPRGSLRVAKLGDAILPLEFASPEEARAFGLPADQMNANRLRQAVQFLAQHADPTYTAKEDPLAHAVYALSAGILSPEAALRIIRQANSLPIHAFSKNGGSHHVRGR